MTVPSYIIIPMKDGDADSVVTFIEEDLSCQYPRRSYESLPQEKTRRATDTLIMPRRRRSFVLSNHTLKSLEAIVVEDDGIIDDAQSFSCSEDDSFDSYRYLEEEKMALERSSDIPSPPQRRATLVLEDLDLDCSDSDDISSGSSTGPSKSDKPQQKQPRKRRESLRRRSQQMPPQLPLRKASSNNLKNDICFLRNQADHFLLSSSMHGRTRVIKARISTSRTA